MEARNTYRVVLFGAGFISDIHARALGNIKEAEIVAIVDPNTQAAHSLAQKYGITQTFADVDDVLNAIEFDAAHILVPPNHHYSLAHTLLAHGKHILVEKPLAETPAQCDTLTDLARQQGLTLAVNQNFIFHPALIKAQVLLEQKKIGPVKSVTLNYEMPLRQLDAGQFGHWMFSDPVNILLEQAVHPLSQLFALLGQPQGAIRCRSSKPRYLAGRLPFVQRLDVIGELSIPFHFSFAMGQDFPVWQIKIIGEDGVIDIDIINNQLLCHTRSRFLPALDIAINATRQAGSTFYQGMRQLIHYSAAIAGLGPSQDPFYLSMLTSMQHFYQSLAQKRAPIHNAGLGRDIIGFCHTLAEEGFPTFHTEPETKAGPIFEDNGRFDVLVIGGTGFIGKQVVKQLLAADYTVGVMARNLNALPELFHQPGITLLQGNVRDKQTVNNAVSKARYVINLAHGGGSGSWQDIHEAMVVSAKTIADACLAHNTRRLVHVGSIASLYLGDKTTITSATLPDPQPELRAEYSRAKAQADQQLLNQYPGLDFVLLRPGVVIGEGGLLNHTGVGFFNNCQHFIGWNMGNNALPFVLVDDVASATVAALTAPDIKGKALNIVGDVRPNAKEYVAMLHSQLDRPFRYIPQPTEWLYAQEIGKWVVKRIAGRQLPIPALRDLRSRAMTATFDNTEEKALLGWQPVSDRAEFIRRAIEVHKHADNPPERQA